MPTKLLKLATQTYTRLSKNPKFRMAFSAFMFIFVRRYYTLFKKAKSGYRLFQRLT